MRASVGVLAVVVGWPVLAVVVAGPAPASAEVEHGQGFAAVVDGYRSWFGSYRLGELGEVWCVDHGIAAPDEALAYEPTSLDDHAPETRRAIGWAVGRHGVGVDRVGAAALMLVLHDLMGARYPSGPLSVDALSPSRLSGFEGREAEVVARARAIKADAVAMAGVVGPLSLQVEVDGVAAGDRGALRARVVDANGSGVGDVVVHPSVTGAELLDGEVDRRTGADGSVAWSFVAGAGPNRFDLRADVPGADLVALRPTRRAAQRVARPAVGVVQGEAGFEGVVRRALTIQKHGDAEPSLPVAGARFRVSGVDGEVIVGPDGRTPPVMLLPGTYEVTEVAPPAGYEVAGPWTVVVNDADVVLDVLDHAVTGRLDLRKVDARTGEPLEGAEFDVVRDADGQPIVDWSAPLLPGRYRIRERVAPPHHRRSEDEVVAEVRAGERTEVRIENVGLAAVAFQKHPPLAGATFAVTVGSAEQGRCTTDERGRCALPDDALEAGTSVCWTELEAPPGWARAEGGCLQVGAAGTTTTIEVEEQALPPASPPVEPAAPADSPPPTAPPPIVSAEEPAPAPAEATEVLDAPPIHREERPPELPRTGPPATRRLAGTAFVLLGIGLALLIASRRRLAL